MLSTEVVWDVGRILGVYSHVYVLQFMSIMTLGLYCAQDTVKVFSCFASPISNSKRISTWPTGLVVDGIQQSFHKDICGVERPWKNQLLCLL